MVFAEVSTSQSALLQMKKSKTWFLADTKIVKGLTDDWVIEKTQCSADIKNIRAKGFTESETMTICEALKDDTLKQLVSDTVKTQRLFGILFGVGVLIWMIVIVFQMASAKAAIDINRAVTNTDSLSSESTGSVSQ
ncbi:hypothetical protein FGKAn22_02400 [Ferrigenium kumadai]|uniref:Uncharacterized protein n=2 Tax=Ferrigenium kumadai TaxID=1682490 RepID=A0AAN1SXE8_9PROT|nr:hypothetical protein FGKAn22_02400 [Ferrigenium kumadai]